MNKPFVGQDHFLKMGRNWHQLRIFEIGADIDTEAEIGNSTNLDLSDLSIPGSSVEILYYGIPIYEAITYLTTNYINQW